MGFLLGFLVATAVMSGGNPSSHLQSMIGNIPLRCLAALDISETEYRVCRMPSLLRELNDTTRFNAADAYGTCGYIWMGREDQIDRSASPLTEAVRETCKASKALDLELKALSEMRTFAQSHQNSAK